MEEECQFLQNVTSAGLGTLLVNSRILLASPKSTRNRKAFLPPRKHEPIPEGIGGLWKLACSVFSQKH